ncbi:polysaccharide deacetylase family protein [Rugamonas sp.]|uniref:polysaccharide deacetylase family protein n=1 Tax=Rugamonas sp. TaxID=1926287 RepID=UPI0025D9D6C3|nr:polysaccharide deacetylase family protein [Rugamonas sp.]
MTSPAFPHPRSRPLTLPRTLLAATLLLAAFAPSHAAAQAEIGHTTIVDNTPATPPAIHTVEEETRHIRKHSLKRLNDKLTVEATTLELGCKYESDIATAPPPMHVALTFDDGPSPQGTELILGLLKKYNIPATFFMIGEKVEKYPELMALVRASGHQVIGNHSWDHPNFHDIGAVEQGDEVLRDEAVLAADVTTKLFRYPYGNSSCETNQLVRARGYKIVGWHIDSCDWAYDKTGSVDAREAISCGVLPQYRDDYVGHVVSAARARKGGIILMHEIHPNTLKKLEQIIVAMQADGFIFGSILDADFQPSLR